MSEDRSSDIVVVGVDCATQASSVGLARVVVASSGLPRLTEIRLEPSWEAIDARVTDWMTSSTLLALDAPLGWPATLGERLHAHQAGQRLDLPSNALFRRRTDDVVASELGKRPLDVGADRIARTAVAALALLDRLRGRTGRDLPLAWSPGSAAAPSAPSAPSAIEVYPAATLSVRGWPSRGYKGKTGDAVRGAILSALRDELLFDADAEAQMLASDHALDAALSALAGADFLRGDVIVPTDEALARREGWIWVKRP